MSLRISRRQFGVLAASALAASQLSAAEQMKIPVPGTGKRLTQVGDDFEDEKWSYNANLPKSSYNIDKQTRLPGGMSLNDRWFEAALRGTPDVVKRVPTPPGGLEGSTGAMLATLKPGVPGRVSHTFQQDDFLANVRDKLGGYVLVNQMPNVTCRVWVPPMDKWEARYGSSFGYRMGLRATHFKVDKETKERGREEYWPGFFLQRMQGQKGDVAQLVVRSNENGQDLPAKTITEPGWWTLGMSLTANGQVHYFAKAGVEELDTPDYLGSYFPYGYKAYVFDTFFFNVITQDDGRTWSTGWIIDDPAMYLAAQPADKKPQPQPAPVSTDSPETPATQAPAEVVPATSKKPAGYDYFR